MPRKPYKWFPSPYPPYQASLTGEIRCGKNPIVQSKIAGIPTVSIKTFGGIITMPVDVMVAFTFKGPPPDDPYLPVRCYRVAHLNGDICDNSADNLAWVEDADEKFDAFRRLMQVPAYYTPGLQHAR